MENNISTVAYRSNLYPTSSISFREDRRFLAQVHDPFSLEQMKKHGLSLDSFQEKEYRQASVHCSYAFKDDYPWGTISMPDGKKTVVCRCTNTKCHLFVKCRPDFDLAELDVYDENKQSTALVFSLEKIKQSEKISPSQDQEAANALFRKPASSPGAEVKPNDAPNTTDSSSGKDIGFVIPDAPVVQKIHRPLKPQTLHLLKKSVRIL